MYKSFDEQRAKHILCPCHQFIYNVTWGIKVLFGPAERSLQKLTITVEQLGI